MEAKGRGEERWWNFERMKKKKNERKRRDESTKKEGGIGSSRSFESLRRLNHGRMKGAGRWNRGIIRNIFTEERL